MTTTTLSAAQSALEDIRDAASSASDATQYDDALSDVDIISISSGSDDPPAQLMPIRPSPPTPMSPVHLVAGRRRWKVKKRSHASAIVAPSPTHRHHLPSSPVAPKFSKATGPLGSSQNVLANVLMRLDIPTGTYDVADSPTTAVDPDADDELTDEEGSPDRWDLDSVSGWGKTDDYSDDVADGDWDVTVVPSAEQAAPDMAAATKIRALDPEVKAEDAASQTIINGPAIPSIHVVEPDHHQDIAPSGAGLPPMSPPAPPPPSRARSPGAAALDPPDRCVRPPPPPQTKSAPTTEDIAQYWKTAEPLGDWVADYIWAICSLDLQNPIASRRLPQPTPIYLANAVKTVLRQTLLPPAAIFLALYYIQKLPVTFLPTELYPVGCMTASFRLELFGTKDMLDQAPYRLFCMGAMLANKWLEDNTFTNKTWHDVSGLPLRDLTLVENYALTLLAYDLTVSDPQWNEWLATLRKYHVALPHIPPPLAPIGAPLFPDPHAIVLGAIDTSLRDHGPVTPFFREPIYVGKTTPSVAADARDEYELVFEIDEGGPIRDEYVPRRKSLQGADSDHSVRLPAPAPWSPADDEIVNKPRAASAPRFHTASISTGPTTFIPQQRHLPPAVAPFNAFPYAAEQFGMPHTSHNFPLVHNTTHILGTFDSMPPSNFAIPPHYRPVPPSIPSRPSLNPAYGPFSAPVFDVSHVPMWFRM